MIDHVSIPVSDLSKSSKFYEEVLAEIGHKKLVNLPNTVGFGKSYPEFWLNARPDLCKAGINDGFHVCLRAKSEDCVTRFYDVAIKCGATSDGKPGLRTEYANNYYAAFVKDRDGNRIEMVTFVS